MSRETLGGGLTRRDLIEAEIVRDRRGSFETWDPPRQPDDPGVRPYRLTDIERAAFRGALAVLCIELALAFVALAVIEVFA